MSSSDKLSTREKWDIAVINAGAKMSTLLPWFVVKPVCNFLLEYTDNAMVRHWRRQLHEHYTIRRQQLLPGHMTPEEYRENFKRRNSAAATRALLPLFDFEHNRARAAVGLPRVQS